MNQDLFDLPDASDRSRFAVFGRVIRCAEFLALLAQEDPLLPAVVLVAFGDRFADGAVFFALCLPAADSRPGALGRPDTIVDGPA